MFRIKKVENVEATKGNSLVSSAISAGAWIIIDCMLWCALVGC